MNAANRGADNPLDSEREAVARAFGAENRARLLKRYFDESGAITPANAWQHVYRLLPIRMAF